MAYMQKFQTVSQDNKLKHLGRHMIRAKMEVLDEAERLLVDSGTTGLILGAQLVKDSQLIVKKTVRPMTVTTATVETIESAGTYYMTLITLKIENHKEKLV